MARCVVAVRVRPPGRSHAALDDGLNLSSDGIRLGPKNGIELDLSQEIPFDQTQVNAAIRW